MKKIIALILLLIAVPVSAEKSAYELYSITVYHTDDTAIEVSVHLNDKDGWEIASDGMVTISILDEPPVEKRSGIGGQRPVSNDRDYSGIGGQRPVSNDGDYVYIMDHVGRMARVQLNASPDDVIEDNYDVIEDNAEPEIFNRTYKVRKSDFETKPYVCWESPEIKYSEFNREPNGEKCWVTASFTTPDGRILKYDGYGGEFIY